MVVITKGKKAMTVSRSAYNNFYKQNGWEIANGDNKNEKPEEVIEQETVEKENSQDDVTDDDWADIEEEESEEEGIEKPLSEMNRQELENKAAELGIDISNAKSNKQLRELIRNNQ